MHTDEFNLDFPWMTEEIKNAIRQQDKIVKDQDIEGLFHLTDNDDFSIVLFQILNNRCAFNPHSLNSVQRVLFLCMHLENAGQADHILSFLQDDFPEYSKEVIVALNEIGATKSAEIIRQAVALLPENGVSFYECADKKTQDLMNKLDSEFSNYPDGLMPDLYRKYAEFHRSNF